MKKAVFTGTATALITPFKSESKEVDYISFEKLIDFQLSASVDALVIAGTTGEASTLSAEEKSELINIAKAMSGDVPVIAGTGSNNTIEALRKSNDAEKQGVNGLLIVTPYYNKCTQEGLIEHYFFIAERVSTPIIVYNVPSRTGVNILPETYKILASHKNITGIKEASPDMSAFCKTMSKSMDIHTYSGNDDLTVSMISQGAKGVISVVSNIIPKEMKIITDLCLSGNFTKARMIFNRYSDLMNLMFCEVNPIPVKSACAELFGTENSLRLPLTKIRKENQEKIKKSLQSLSVIN